MVSFSCSRCGDVVKKPKVQTHAQQCGTGAFSCVDCMETFDLNSIQKHTSCLSEADRYQGTWRQRTNNFAGAAKKNHDSSDEEGDSTPKKKGGIARVKRPELTFSSSDDSDDDKDSKPKKVVPPAKAKSNGLSPLLSPRRTTVTAAAVIATLVSKRSRSPKRPFTALPPPAVTTKREVAADSDSDVEEVFELKETIPLGTATLLGEIIDEIVAEQRELNGVAKPKRSVVGQELVLRYRKRLGNAIAGAVSKLLDERNL